MSDNTGKVALVTGATSGLGFEAAAQLGESGYDRITVTGRTIDKAEAARAQLAERTGRDIFDTLAVDFGSAESVRAAAAELARRGTRFNFLLLNAGLVGPSDLVKTDDDIEITFAATLIGHHRLAMQMISDELLADNARIVIAGSEAARGDVPTMTAVDLPDFAREHHDGDLAAAAENHIRSTGAVKYKSTNAYANAKLFVAYWAAELARKLPPGTTVNAISPGSAPDTGAARSAPFFMRKIMVPMMKAMPAKLGMAAPVSVAAARYLEASEFPDDVTGEFFASAPKKMTGALHKVVLPHVLDRDSQAAAWDAIVSVSGGVDYPSHV